MSANPINAAFLAQRAAMQAKYPEQTGPGWQGSAATVALFAGALALYVFGWWELGFSFSKIANGLGRLADIALLMVPPTPETWARFWLYFEALGQTLAIAFLGTLFAAILAFPIGFLAAKNVVANRVVHFLTRRTMDSVRSVDTLIWALIWINVVGLGPFAGALAIMCGDLGAFAKLMSEAIETADRKPVDGITATGGSRLEAIRFGILPQILPVIASQVLYYFESNTRSATIIGIVGAGGIGLHLSEQIRVLEWNHASFIILMVLVTVALIDTVSQRLRNAIIGRRAG